MKLILAILFLCVLQISASVYSQATKFSFSVKDKPIVDILKAIEDQSEFRFFYQNEQVNTEINVNIDFENKTVDEILDYLFRDQGIEYKIFKDNLILLTPKDISTSFDNMSPDEMMIFQQRMVSGIVTDENGNPLPGVSIVVKGTTTGTITDANGAYSISNIPPDATLQFSFVGMKTQEKAVGNQTIIDVVLEEEMVGLDDVVVVGYGTQKRSDITGSVVSVPQERFESKPNTNIFQAIQGSISGTMVQTVQQGARPSEVIMIRGRNSIKASNEPLVIIDGIQGSMESVVPTDVQSVDILKDASAAAIYGSRSANGVILITTKKGVEGRNKISYNGYCSIETYTELPDYLTGDEFYNYKMERAPWEITQSEKEIYDSGTWVKVADHTMRTGVTQQHNLSMTGGFKNVNYFISGNLMDVKSIRVNDNYRRLSNRINLDIKAAKWLSFGTRTNIAYHNENGASPEYVYGGDGFGGLNPLTKLYNDDGSLTMYPWKEDTYWANPLEPTLYDDKDESYDIATNTFAIVDFPFVPGLSYRINTGFRMEFDDIASYAGRNTKTGAEVLGLGSTNKIRTNSTTIENVLTYKKEFGSHNIFATGLYSYETRFSSSNSVSARKFPNDFVSWYGANGAESKTIEYSYIKSFLVSQMLRLNYDYAKRYLITITNRWDGYSGFGPNHKWGFFPSIALGWNLVNEAFFPWKDLFNQLKPRFSWGINGNQAVSPYSSISRFSSYDYVAQDKTLIGYVPGILGQDNLSWESSKTINLGLDFGIFKGRISGDINLFSTNTKDLLLNRSISAVHGLTNIIQNIGKTNNKGIELSFVSKNIEKSHFQWTTTGNISFMKNEIVSLYGILDKEGNEVNDVLNTWFIGKPIKVYYDFVYDGVWQLNEAEEAAKWGSQPGYVKIKDFDNDYKISENDKRIIGQQDPKIIYGMTNSFTYKNFRLDIFIHGVHGVTVYNGLFQENQNEVRRNIINLNHWTPDNPTNDWYMNKYGAERMGGQSMYYSMGYEDASFVRIKDITLSYDFPKNLIKRGGLYKLSLYVNVRNLFTFSKVTYKDPEVLSANAGAVFPLQKSFVFGVNLDF